MHSTAKAWRALVFTDIVGSTEWWEKFPELMAPMVRRHEAVLHAVFAEAGGRVFKTVGDAFCVVFEDVVAAVAGAAAAQRAIRAEDWGELGALEIRAGVHAGEVEERDGDYFGPTLNRMARIVDAAHGGQILLSAAIVGALHGRTVKPLGWRELGEFRLRSLETPERLYQLEGPGLPTDFPPPRSMSVLPHNLPVSSTGFVGRERELSHIAESLAGETRLLTLLGPGGTGKTRLALEAGASLITNFPGGVWLSELALVDEGGRVPEAVAAVFGTRNEGSLPAEELLRKMLCQRRVLLLLDNCEHVLAPAARLVGSLLAGCPHLKVLATSRQPLGLRGEEVFSVPPLGVPDWHRAARRVDAWRELAESEGVQLFLQRARAVLPDFALTRENAAAIAEICARLDGLPLALELAAARLRILPPEQIATRLSDRFRLLRGSAKDRLSHQQTLGTLIDWSHDLLSEPEKALFRRLGVFVAARSLAAVEKVCSDEETDPYDLLDHLQALVEKSLVRMEEAAPPGLEPNYTMLESIWEYARARLRESGEEERVQEAHTTYYLAWAERAAPEFLQQGQARWLAVFDREWFNLQAVLLRLLRLQRWEEAARLLTALGRPIEVRGYAREARELFLPLLEARDKISADTLPGLLMVVGRIFWVLDQYDLCGTYFRKAEEKARERGQHELALFCGAFLGFIHWGNNEVTAAEECFRRGLDDAVRTDNRRVEALCQTGLARVAMHRDDLPDARAMAEKAAATYAAIGDRWIEGLVQGGLAQIAVRQKDLPRARRALAAGTEIAVELGNDWTFPYLLHGLAEVAWEDGHPEEAARFFGAAEKLRRQHGFELSAMEEAGAKRLSSTLADTFPPGELVLHLRSAHEIPPLELLQSAAKNSRNTIEDKEGHFVA